MLGFIASADDESTEPVPADRELEDVRWFLARRCSPLAPSTPTPAGRHRRPRPACCSRRRSRLRGSCSTAGSTGRRGQLSVERVVEPLRAPRADAVVQRLGPLVVERGLPGELQRPAPGRRRRRPRSAPGPTPPPRRAVTTNRSFITPIRPPWLVSQLQYSVANPTASPRPPAPGRGTGCPPGRDRRSAPRLIARSAASVGWLS